MAIGMLGNPQTNRIRGATATRRRDYLLQEPVGREMVMVRPCTGSAESLALKLG